MDSAQARDLAQIAYEIYAERQNWKDMQGEQLTDWANLNSLIKSAWIAAIQTVLDLARNS